MGPKQRRSNLLSAAEEEVIVAFRKQTLLSLDDRLYALQATFTHMTRSSLHCCLHCLGISRLPDTVNGSSKKKRFNKYPIGYFHLSIAEMGTEPAVRLW